MRRRSTVQSLPLQQGFLGLGTVIVSSFLKWLTRWQVDKTSSWRNNPAPSNFEAKPSGKCVLKRFARAYKQFTLERRDIPGSF